MMMMMMMMMMMSSFDKSLFCEIDAFQVSRVV